ncbi:MAG: hypothetical protein K2L54_00775 [Clostridiales bacterium]|nr:hypothetical protein [Clostridiales bacterium]
MSTVIKSKWKKAIPSLVLLGFIVLLAGLSFLPAVRNSQKAAPVSAGGMDGEALRVLESCRAYAAVNDFQTEMNGKIKAKVFGVPYTQNIHGTRSVRGEDFTDVTESVSALVKAGIKREGINGKYSAVRGDYKNKSFVYGVPTQCERDEYIAAYGMPATGLVKYKLDDSIIVAEQVGENVFRYVLDVRRATQYSRNEVKTTLGGKSYPEYESVEFTLTIDGDRAVKITSTEKFRIDKFGGTHCVAQYTEVFNYSDPIE